MENYTPVYENIHHIRYTLQDGIYVGHFTRVVGGNCRGAALLDTQVFDWLNQDNIDRLVENDCALKFKEDGEYYAATLTAPNGDECLVGYEGSEMGRILVAVEIVGCEPEDC